MNRLALAVVSLALGVSTGAGAAVFRCTATDGSVTYQDYACADASRAAATDIPLNFPPPNDAERARILQREAELERRLEARREREAREAAVRLASAPPAPVAEPVESYPLYFPVALPRAYSRHRHAGRPPYAGPGTGSLSPRP